jgi:cellulose biosynthesis protein BcsQ
MVATRVALFARKGGAGKTALTALLGRELVRHGQRVLVVDLDPQVVSVSTAFGIDTNGRLPFTAVDLIAGPEGRPFDPAIVISGKLGVVPGNQEQVAILEHALCELHKCVRAAASPGARPRRAILDARMAAFDVDYDFALLDCPTALGEVTSNAIEAADLIVSPIDMKYRANVLSVTDLLQHVAALGSAPEIMFVGNKWVPRERQCRLALADAQRLCGARLFGTLVPECTAIPLSLAEHRDVRATSELAAQVMEAVWRLGQAVIDFSTRLQRSAAGADSGGEA